MAQAITSTTLIATKLASGNVRLQFQNAVGGIQFIFIINSADLTNINTNVNGGSTGANRSFFYGQDANKLDYDHDHQKSEGN